MNRVLLNTLYVSVQDSLLRLDNEQVLVESAVKEDGENADPQGTG